MVKTILGLVSFAVFLYGVALEAVELRCGSIVIVNSELLNFTDTERRLICGDKRSSRTSIAWRNVPLNQAKRHFETFIQDRGFFSPKFIANKDGTTTFNPGSRSHIESLVGENLSESIDIQDFRHPLGQPLTPDRVSDVKSWVQKRLQEKGWPCPKLTVRATFEDGKIYVLWKNPGEQSVIAGVLSDNSIGNWPDVLRRYDAFRIGDDYSLVETQITSQRAMRSRTVVSHSLEPICENRSRDDQIILKETVLAGPPRMIAVGVGVNTEGIALARGSWVHTRLGKSLSLAEASVRASLKEQTARALLNWYYKKKPSRQALAPSFQLGHANERAYEVVTLKPQVLWRNGFEIGPGALDFGVGPGWRSINQLEGLGPTQSQFFTIEANASYASHLFEYYATNPRRGFQMDFDSTFVPFDLMGIGNPFRYRIDYTGLMNPFGYDPPWLVLGMRGSFFGTLTRPGAGMGDLPFEFRQWIGGGRDVRGFGRQELPGNSQGALIGSFLGLETRLPSVLPFDELEPFFFTDFAWLRHGQTSSKLETDAFWSPGFGLRWKSPIGAVRANLAHGYVVGQRESHLSHWQFYVSLGEEF